MTEFTGMAPRGLNVHERHLEIIDDERKIAEIIAAETQGEWDIDTIPSHLLDALANTQVAIEAADRATNAEELLELNTERAAEIGRCGVRDTVKLAA